MGEKIGTPLTVETGRPRVLPKTLPLQLPEEVPQKEKVPVPVSRAVSERANHDTRVYIRRAAKVLGISEQQVATMIIVLADHISGILRVGARRKSMMGKAQ